MANEVQGALKFNVNGTWLPVTTLVGERGPTGGTVDVAVGRVEQTTGPTVSVSVSDNVAYFNFGLVKGDRGETGSYGTTTGVSSSNQTVQVVDVATGTQTLVFSVPTVSGNAVSDWQVLVRVSNVATKCTVGRAALANFGAASVLSNGYDDLDDINSGETVLFSFTGYGDGYIMSRANGYRNINT